MAQDAPSFSSDDVITGAAQGRLKSFIERIERLEEDEAVVKNDKKEVYAEAKGEGFDVKILRKVISIRKQDKAKLSEEEARIDLYMSAIDGAISVSVGRTEKAEAPRPLDIAVARMYIDEAILAIQVKNASWTVRDLANDLRQPEEVTRAVIAMIEKAGICTRADNKGQRRFIMPADGPFTAEQLKADRFEQFVKNSEDGARNTIAAIEDKDTLPIPDDASAEERYRLAVHYVTTDRKASTSYIQRKLQIGYNAASALMERMEAAGIVSPSNHVGKRDILVGPTDGGEVAA